MIEMIMWIVIGILLWTVVSCVYAYLIMGDKLRKDKWYDFVLLIPALFIVIIIARIEQFREDK